MIARASLRIALVSIAGLVVGCQSPNPPIATASQAQAGPPGLAALYHKATRPHRLAVRKPVRDERERAMAMLATQAGELLRDAEQWDSAPRLAGLQNPDAARQSVSEFRASLEALKVAAERQKVSMLKSEYAMVTRNYQRVLETTTPENQ